MRDLAQRLTALELPLVGLAVAGCLVTDRLLLPTLGLALLFWGLHWLAYGTPRRRTPADLPIIGLVLLLPMTLWITALPDVTQVQVLRLLVGIALYYSITTWTGTLRRLQAALGGLIAVGLGLALAAPVLVDWQSFPMTLLPTAVYARQPFLLGDGVNPNVLAGQLALLLPLILAMIIAPQRAPRAWGTARCAAAQYAPSGGTRADRITRGRASSIGWAGHHSPDRRALPNPAGEHWAVCAGGLHAARWLEWAAHR